MKAIRLIILGASILGLAGCDLSVFTNCYVYKNHPGVCHNNPPPKHVKAS